MAYVGDSILIVGSLWPICVCFAFINIKLQERSGGVGLIIGPLVLVKFNNV